VAPEDSVGVLNFTDGGSADIREMAFKGYDAAIVVPAPDDDAPGPVMEISDVDISDTVRGILWRAGGSVHIKDTEISDTAHNGMSFRGTETRPLVFRGKNIFLSDLGNLGIYVNTASTCDENGNNVFDDVTILGSNGPGLAVINGGACLFNSRISFTHTAGVYVQGAAVLVQDSYILYILPGTFGVASAPGIGVLVLAGAAPSHAILVGNEIKNVQHASVANLGSFVQLGGNELACAAFNLVGEPHEGFNYTFDNLGGNVCDVDCPATLGLRTSNPGECVPQSSGIQAPPMLPAE
jgi:hypothetical protein